MKNDDLKLQNAMRNYAATLSATHTPPLATQVWLRAKQRRNQSDLRRAERPMRFMQFLAIACVVVIAGSFGRNHGALASLTTVGTPLLAAIWATIVVSLTACWIMVRASRTH